MISVKSFWKVWQMHLIIYLPGLFKKKKFWELSIIKCIYHTFQELFTEINYLNYFKSYVVIEYYKRKKTYCRASTQAYCLVSVLCQKFNDFRNMKISTDFDKNFFGWWKGTNIIIFLRMKGKKAAIPGLLCNPRAKMRQGSKDTASDSPTK